MNMRTVTIFQALWNGHLYAWALTHGAAKISAISHSTYGDPNIDEYDLGNSWASEQEGEGWWINEHEALDHIIEATVYGNPAPDETAHLGWTCPTCKCHYSEDLTASDTSPLLVTCSCCGEMKYIIAQFEYPA